MDEYQFKTLCELARDNTLSQRDLSKKMGLSLGRINYIIGALIDKGLIKAERFRNSRKKLGYMYILTPDGVNEKFRQTNAFIRRKTVEYEELRQEIEVLKREDELMRRRIYAVGEGE
ncbi:MAG: MarR family EPS-associated transcriptional regulator [Nitrospirae bacterium]|nr:MarR family EPS-associated transcriptional regulator [Nitrospirota bacterium]